MGIREDSLEEPTFPGCCRRELPRIKFDSPQRFKEAAVRQFLVLMIIASLAFLAGCGSGSSGGTPSGVPTSGSNVQAIAVDGGPVAGAIYPNGAFTNVTICNPGTTTCQTIDGIL